MYQSRTHRTHLRSGLVDRYATAVGSRTASVYTSPDVGVITDSPGKAQADSESRPNSSHSSHNSRRYLCKKKSTHPLDTTSLIVLGLPNEGYTTVADTLLRICCFTNYVSSLWSMIPFAIRSRDPTKGGRTCLFFFRAPRDSWLVS